MSRRVLLFDLDGVLVTLGGYHRALQATVNWYSRQMGLGDRAPDTAAIESLETGGLTVEWDSSAICLAILVTDLWVSDPRLRLPETWEAIVSAIRNRAAHACPNPDYGRWAEEISAAVSRGRPAPRVALDLLLAAAQVDQAGTRGLELRNALEVLLGRTRDFHRSVTMRVFQQFTLGSQGFRAIYGEEPSFETPSKLWESDGPTLSAEETRVLVSCIRGTKACAAVFTLRLTRPALPSAAGGEYAPEAEIALEKVGLAQWPVVGAGQLRWFASRRAVDPDTYLKPSPVHPLAAIGRALGASDEESLLSACGLFEENRLTGSLGALVQEGEIDLHVFEDSPFSLRGSAQAVRLLRRQGARVVFHPWGIGSTPRRIQFHRELGYPVSDTLGQALARAGILAHARA